MTNVPKVFLNLIQVLGCKVKRDNNDISGMNLAHCLGQTYL